MIKNLKRVISMVLVVIMVTAMMPMSVISTSAATVEGESVGLSGSGTASSPYLIGTVDDYKQFVTLANSTPTVCGKLTANIQLNSYSLNSSTLIPPWGSQTVYTYTPIGTYSKPYTGTFDGAGYTINGFYFSNTSETNGKYAGVFGYVGSTGVIKNLTLTNTYIKAHSYIGAICGYNGGTIERCSARRTKLISTADSTVYVGGICGYNWNTIQNCSVNGIQISRDTSTVKGKEIGGICGRNQKGIIKSCTVGGYDCASSITGDVYIGGICGSNIAVIDRCCNTLPISGSGYIGGISGWSYSGGEISNCYASCKITADNYRAGGICGVLITSTSSMKNCFYYYNSSGAVTAPYYAGAIVGMYYEGTISNCYYSSADVAKDGNGQMQNGVGNATTGSSTADGSISGVQTVKKSSDQFKSGEVAWLLNNGVTDGTQAFYQTVNSNSYPYLSGKTVYYGYESCTATTKIYSNSPLSTTQGHKYSNGFCTFCDAYEPAGDADKDNWYDIDNAGKLYWFAQQVNAGNTAYKAELTADITVNTNVVNNGSLSSNANSFRKWTPIGQSVEYMGNFQGYDHTISGLYCVSSTENAGLFGIIGDSKIVDNVVIKDSYFSNSAIRVAAIAGYNKGYIRGCCVEDSIISGAGCVGGIAGDNTETILTSFIKEGTYIKNTLSDTGGIAAVNSGGITSCSNAGTINSGSSTYEGVRVGGIVGKNTGAGKISKCYNVGTINGDDKQTGGIVGLMSSTGVVDKCFNYGIVSGLTYVGSICGQKTSGTITNCYYLENTAKDNNNKYANGIGNATAGTLTPDVAGETVKKTKALFATGELTYLMSNGYASVYSQKLGTDPYPILYYQSMTNHGKEYIVYYGYENCGSATKTYSNTNLPTTKPAHTWSNGKCTVCGTSCSHKWSSGKCTVCGVSCTHSYSNGFCKVCDVYEPATDSDKDGYVEINNGGKLYWFASQVNGGNATLKAELTANITINSNVINSSGTLNSSSSYRAWTPIGNTSVSYAGEFDGANYTISGLYFNNTGTDRIGLFGNVQNAKIKNVGVIGSYFNGKYAVGAICGKANTGSEITNCYNKSTVNGNNHVAGICGDNAQGTITKCYNTGVVASTSNKAGGITGSNWGSTTSTPGTIDNCYNTGTISGSHQVGGLVGSNYNSILKNSHNYGTVNGNYYVGGICGQDTSGTITNCYYLENKATDSNGTKQFGVGNATAGSTTADTSSRTVKKTATQFKSGEVAYYLNGKTATSSSVWRQTVNSNSYPTLSGSIVYYGYANCGSTEKTYSNTNLSTTQPTHSYSNGFCSGCGGYEPATDSDGDGYVEINNGGKLYWFATQVNGGNTTLKAKLTANITVNSNVLNSDGTLNSSSSYREWIPIGTSTNQYAGVFDGNGKSISGLYFNTTSSSSYSYMALFRYVGTNGVVKNTTLKGSYFASYGATSAGFAGYNNGLIENCVNESSVDYGIACYCFGTIKNSRNNLARKSGICDVVYADGVVQNCYNQGNVNNGIAYTNNGKIESCINKATVKNGICDTNSKRASIINCSNTANAENGICNSNSGTISNSYNSGAVTVSGISYRNNDNAVITDCYNTGAVNSTKTYYAGGISGANYGTITKCYNTAAVKAEDTQYVGGIAGQNGNIIRDCYNSSNITGSEYVGGISGSGGIIIAYCYNSGLVKGSSNVGAIAGDKNAVGSYQSNYYLEHSAVDGKGTIQNGFGTPTAGSVIDDREGISESKTKKQFNSGEVTYLLNNSKSSGDIVWYQTIGEDAYPCFEGDIVYFCYNSCSSKDGIYSNTETATVRPPHKEYENGFCTVCDEFEPATDSDGDTYYEIDNAGKLYWFSQQVSSGKTNINGKITKNIVVNENVLANVNADGYREWTPIGNSVNAFNGVLDGNGKTISGIYYNYEESVVGLVGYLGTEGTIKNVSLVDSFIKARNAVGGICGENYGTIVNCSNHSTIESFGEIVTSYRLLSNTGGIAGLSQGTVEKCYNTGSVTGCQYVGGIVGNSDGTIKNCYNTGTITAKDFGATGSMVRARYTGGIAGQVESVESCYNTGRVSGYLYVGSVSGDSPSSGIKNCYYLPGTATKDANRTATGTYSSDAKGKVEAVSGAELASGKIAYLLNGSTSTGTLVWYQTIGTDSAPQFDGDTVYAYKIYSGCATDSSYVEEYTNNKSESGKEYKEDHVYDNGFCVGCDKYETALDADKDGYVEIDNGGKLYWFATQVNGGNRSLKAKLTADIYVNKGVLNGNYLNTDNIDSFRTWRRIGNSIGTVNTSYIGTFDGQGHTISGLYCVQTDEDNAGLFGEIAKGGTVKGITLRDSYMSNTYRRVAGIAAVNHGTVSDCYVASAISGASMVGGVVASNGGTIIRCGNSINVDNSSDSTGGISGYNSGTIKYCYNYGALTGKTYLVGGIVGCNAGTVMDCFNYGQCKGTDKVGGIVGETNSGNIADCYNYDEITGTSNVGSVCGRITAGSITNCYYIASNRLGVGAQADGLTVEATSKTNAQFKSGEVAYLLNHSTSTGTLDWYQNIDSNLFPMLSGSVVYGGYDSCKTEEMLYSNSPLPSTQKAAHVYENGFCTGCDKYEEAKDSDGDGYVEIDNGGKLYWFSEQVNGGNTTLKAELTKDIYVNQNVLNSEGELSTGTYRQWTPIGNDNVIYAGIFDGGNHTVSGLYFNDTTVNYVGLFGQTVSGSEIKNVGVIGSYFEAQKDMGAVVAVCYGTITNCYNTSSVISTGNYIGGVCGHLLAGSITECYNSGKVIGNAAVGGIAGQGSADTLVKECYNIGLISGKDNIGGITGHHLRATITDCYNSGDISGRNSIGGICGYSYPDSNKLAKVINCYNIGNVSGTGYYVGSIWGMKETGIITNCYYLANTAKDGNGKVQFGVGNATAGSTTADVEGATTKKTLAQFKSGEVAYLLNEGVTDGIQVWYQTIGTDNAPMFTGKTVYGGYVNCGSTAKTYSNTALNTTKPAHNYDNGFCKVCDVYEPATDSDGDGYVEIDNGGKLYWFAAQVNGGNKTLNAELTKDIYVNQNVLNSNGELNSGTYREWTPIGTSSKEYAGIFDGGNHTISGLYSTHTLNSRSLFFTVDTNGVVDSVGIVDSYIRGGLATSSIALYNYGKITNCYNSSKIYGEPGASGIVVSNFGTITNCCNTGNITTGNFNGSKIKGGIALYNYGTITNCCNTSNIFSLGAAGGIAVNNEGTITNCYNTGIIKGPSGVGGISGTNVGTITNCFYLENTATDSNGTVQFGVGNATAGSTTADVEGQTISKTSEQFASGEVAYLLNSEVTDGSQAWYQTIGTDDYPVFTGETVYYGYENCGSAKKTYSNTEMYDEHPNHTFEDGACIVCGEVLAELKAANLTLDGMIGVNLYINFSDVVFEDENSALTINVPQGTQENGAYQLAYETVEFNVNDSDDFIEQDDELWFRFTCWISAKEMTAPIIAQLKLSDGTLSKTMTYTVKQYGDTIFDSKYGSTYDSQKDIVKSLLNYGAYAQQYFDYRIDELPNTGDYFTEEERNALVIGGDERTDLINNNGLVLDKGAEDKVKYYGSSLLLEDGTVIRHYFLLTDSSIDVSTLNVTIDGVSATAEKKGSFYYVDIKDIPAYSLDKKYTVSVDSMTIEYSCLSYVASALKTYTDENGTCTNASKQNLVNLATSLYKYSNSAKSYAKNK